MGCVLGFVFVCWCRPPGDLLACPLPSLPSCTSPANLFPAPESHRPFHPFQLSPLRAARRECPRTMATVPAGEIHTGDRQGIVKEIGWGTTTIEAQDGSLVMVPAQGHATSTSPRWSPRGAQRSNDSFPQAAGGGGTLWGHVLTWQPEAVTTRHL